MAPHAPLTVKQAAECLGVDQSTIYRLCQGRSIAHRRIGVGAGRIFFTEDDLGAYLAACAVPVGEPEPRVDRVSLEEVRKYFRPQGESRLHRA